MTSTATIISHRDFQARRAVREIELRAAPRPFLWQSPGQLVPVVIGGQAEPSQLSKSLRRR